MDSQIGDTAGKLWHFLYKNPQSTCKQACKALALERTMLYMAVGWLAREDKLSFEDEGRRKRMSLKHGAHTVRS